MVISRVRDLLAGKREAASGGEASHAAAAPAPAAAAVEPAGSLEDYFDRLDAALASKGAPAPTFDPARRREPAPSAAPRPTLTVVPPAAAARPSPHADLDLTGWNPSASVEPAENAPPSAPAEPVSPRRRQSVHRPPPVQSQPTEPRRAPTAPAAAPPASPVTPSEPVSLDQAFAALLAAEQGQALVSPRATPSRRRGCVRGGARRGDRRRRRQGHCPDGRRDDARRRSRCRRAPGARRDRPDQECPVEAVAHTCVMSVSSLAELPFMSDGSEQSHPIAVPDKPALEGLEQKWTAALGRRRDVSIRSHAAASRGVIRSTRRRRPSAARCTSATSSPTPTPTSSRASSGCAARPCSIRWDGTTTACRPSAACRTTSACAAIRRCRTIRRSRRRRSRASSRFRSRVRTSSSCARG